MERILGKCKLQPRCLRIALARNERQSRWDRTYSAGSTRDTFSSGGIVRESRGTRRESRFAFYTHPNDGRVTHGAASSFRRKFDVLTVPGARIYIYRAYGARDKKRDGVARTPTRGKR